MLKILTVPHKVLTSPSSIVKTFDDKLKKLVLEMEETLVAQVDPQGVGLAAPQIGESISLFIIKPRSTYPTQVFINPKIMSSQRSKIKDLRSKKDSKLEGCLSIPQIWAPVTRSSKILLEYQDITGEKHQKWFSGFDAVIVEHEVDHLRGTLFTQRAIEQDIPLYEEIDGKLKKLTIE